MAGQINESCFPNLSYETRLKGFVCCFIIGAALSFFGSFLIFFGNYIGFAFLYSMGTIVALCSSLFLRGPAAQMKGMLKETRLLATIVLMWNNGVLCIVFCVIQFLAFTWYSLSYIPFARDAVKTVLGNMCG